jgi:hypothetical protein
VVELLHQAVDEGLTTAAIEVRARQLRQGRRPPTPGIKHLRVAFEALQRIQVLDGGDAEAELVEQCARQMARIRRLSPGRDRAATTTTTP